MLKISRRWSAGLASAALAGIVVSAGLAGAAASQTPAESKGGSATDPERVKVLPPTAQYVAPKDISFDGVSFVSQGVRLTSQWFVTRENESKRLPTIIMAHGWGGTAAAFREDAIELARAGYRVMLFDYRGWGDSDGRIVLAGGIKGGIPATSHGGQFKAEVKELRGYVDPEEQSGDWFNAVSFAVSQPGVDVDRIGIRGSSYSGGYVGYVAALDHRVKAVVSQVGSFNSTPEARGVPDPAKDRAEADLNATQLATGEVGYPPDRVRTSNGLTGASPGNDRMRWNPMEVLHNLTQPILFVLAEKEEMFPNERQGLVACGLVAGPRKVVMVPGILHHDIYDAERELAITVAIDWFDKHLKAPGATTRIPVDRTEAPRGDCNAPFVRPPGTAAPAAAKRAE